MQHSPKTPSATIPCTITNTCNTSEDTRTGRLPRHLHSVVSLEMSPVDDTFLSGAVDDAVRFWDLRSPEAQGHLRVRGHPTVSYDPTGAVFAIALNERNTVLLYDVRKFDHDPFLTITIDDTAALSQISMPPRIPVITSLSFNQSGQFILVGTAGDVHYVVDSFSGKLVWRLVGHMGLEQASGRGVGMVPQAGISGEELCWTPDGRMVLSGMSNCSRRLGQRSAVCLGPSGHYTRTYHDAQTKCHAQRTRRPLTRSGV